MKLQSTAVHAVSVPFRDRPTSVRGKAVVRRSSVVKKDTRPGPTSRARVQYPSVKFVLLRVEDSRNSRLQDVVDEQLDAVRAGWSLFSRATDRAVPVRDVIATSKRHVQNRLIPEPRREAREPVRR